MQKIKNGIFEIADNKYKVVSSIVIGIFVQKFDLVTKLLGLL
jgi:hypothetical protein